MLSPNFDILQFIFSELVYLKRFKFDSEKASKNTADISVRLLGAFQLVS